MTDEREAFEAGYRFASFIERTKSGTYRHPSTQCAWEGFQAGAAYQREQNAYRLAVDTGLVCAHIGVTNPEDDYETARRKLNDLICWSIQVDRGLGREQVKGLVDALDDLLALMLETEESVVWTAEYSKLAAAYRAGQGE